jgi:polar amino acid transport system substrate-binding protein
MMRKFSLLAVSILIVCCLAAAPAFGAGAFDRILKRGELIVGTSGTQPPLSAKTKSGKLIGMDLDLANLMAKAMDVQLKAKQMPFAELLPALQKGQIDMIISGMTLTTKRNTQVAFVGPYYISGKGILTKTETVATLTDPKAMDKPGFTVTALDASTSKMFVESAMPKATLKPTKTLDEALQMVINGKAKALVADYPFCALMAFKHKDKGLTAGEARFTFEPLAIALPPNDPLLINWTQNFIMFLKGSGALEKLQQKWFQSGDWIKELP